jgi:hypothetical protein
MVVERNNIRFLKTLSVLIDAAVLLSVGTVLATKADTVLPTEA